MGISTSNVPVAKNGKTREIILYVDYFPEGAGRDGELNLTVNEYDFEAQGIRNLGYRSFNGLEGLNAKTSYYFDSLGRDRNTRRFHTKRGYDGRYLSLDNAETIQKMGRILGKLDKLEVEYSRTSSNGAYHSGCEISDYVERFAKVSGATRVAFRIPGTSNGRSGYDGHEYEWLTIAGGAEKVRELHETLLSRGDGQKVNAGDGYTITF